MLLVLYVTMNLQLKQFDNYLNITGSGQLSDDIGLNYLVGANAFSFTNHRTQVQGTGLVFPGFVDLSNATALSSFEDINRFTDLLVL